MTEPYEMMELTCPGCSWNETCGGEDMLDWLRRVGMLRRAKDPGYALVRELFVSSAGRFSCPECGRAGLAVEIASPEEADDDWGEGRLCGACQKPIPPERLEIFPDAEYCAACQDAASDADASEEPEFCPKCGAMMTLRTSRSGGITRYVMACTECRK